MDEVSSWDYLGADGAAVVCCFEDVVFMIARDAAVVPCIIGFVLRLAGEHVRGPAGG